MRFAAAERRQIRSINVPVELTTYARSGSISVRVNFARCRSRSAKWRRRRLNRYSRDGHAFRSQIAIFQPWNTRSPLRITAAWGTREPLGAEKWPTEKAGFMWVIGESPALGVFEEMLEAHITLPLQAGGEVSIRLHAAKLRPRNGKRFRYTKFSCTTWLAVRRRKVA
jgi:hypothetical protein